MVYVVGMRDGASRHDTEFCVVGMLRDGKAAVTFDLTGRRDWHMKLAARQ